MQQPIVVYQMGKVGSTSMAEALATMGFSTFHVHTLNSETLATIVQRHQDQGLRLPGHIRESLHVRKEFLDRGRPLKIITAVRDPIARNISAYFQSLRLYRSLKQEFEEDELQAMMAEFLQKFGHDYPLTWFDREMRAVVGIDVYHHPFPKSDGVQRIQENGQAILLLKVETANHLKVTAIKEFLQISEFSLTAKNVGADKPYSHYYKPFLDRIQLPAAYIDRMYNSRYVQHFYSPEEIHRFRAHWTRDQIHIEKEQVSSDASSG